MIEKRVAQFISQFYICTLCDIEHWVYRVVFGCALLPGCWSYCKHMSAFIFILFILDRCMHIRHLPFAICTKHIVFGSFHVFGFMSQWYVVSSTGTSAYTHYTIYKIP